MTQTLQAAPVVLGVDPGLRNSGWAVVSINTHDRSAVCDAGVITTKAVPAKKQQTYSSAKEIVDCQWIYDELYKVFEDWRPVLVCAETRISGRSIKSAVGSSLYWGVLASVSRKFGLTPVVVNPGDIKKGASGNKTCSKEELQDAIRSKYDTAPVIDDRLPRKLWEHAYDAVGAALALNDHPTVRALRILR